jgi:hypothetical protein
MPYLTVSIVEPWSSSHTPGRRVDELVSNAVECLALCMLRAFEVFYQDGDSIFIQNAITLADD